VIGIVASGWVFAIGQCIQDEAKAAPLILNNLYN
jgi:hypothetical protein